MCRRDKILDDIYSNCLPVDQCFLWLGSDSGDGRGGGYPRKSLDGQTVAVHRVVATHFFGYIPSKKQIDHVCGNRLCLRDDHLEIVTQRENCKRRDKK